MERAQSMTPRLNKTTTTDDGFANASEPPASDWPAGSTCIRRCSREQRVMSNVQCVISIKTPNADQYRDEDDDVNAGSMAWTKGVRATHTLAKLCAHQNHRVVRKFRPMFTPNDVNRNLSGESLGPNVTGWLATG